MKILTIILGVVILLFLQGCGGSSGGGETVKTPTGPPRLYLSDPPGVSIRWCCGVFTALVAIGDITKAQSKSVKIFYGGKESDYSPEYISREARLVLHVLPRRPPNMVLGQDYPITATYEENGITKDVLIDGVHTFRWIDPGP